MTSNCENWNNSEQEIIQLRWSVHHAVFIFNIPLRVVFQSSTYTMTTHKKASRKVGKNKTSNSATKPKSSTKPRQPAPKSKVGGATKATTPPPRPKPRPLKKPHPHNEAATGSSSKEAEAVDALMLMVGRHGLQTAAADKSDLGEADDIQTSYGDFDDTEKHNEAGDDIEIEEESRNSSSSSEDEDGMLQCYNVMIQSSN